MKILYGVSTMGNGHVARAQAIIPKLKKHSEVDILLSGPGYGLDIGLPVKHRSEGLKFDITKRGRIDIRKTLMNAKVLSTITDILNLDLSEYDFVITDSDAISSWAAKLQYKKCLSFGNINTLKSKRFRKDVEANPLLELYVNYEAPGDEYLATHYEQLEDWIFPPIIKDNVRNAKITENNHITVYLHGYQKEFLLKKFKKINDSQWQVFSKDIKKEYTEGNVSFNPINENTFIESLASSKGFLTNAGYTATSEALFLGKKMLVVPINHFEQKLNAKFLKSMGVKIIKRIGLNFTGHYIDWQKNYKPIKKDYPDATDDIVKKILEFASKPKKPSRLPKLKNYKRILGLLK